MNSALFPGCSSTVHPRACGEHLARFLRNHKPHGSSPRLRGTSRPAIVIGVGLRFIPAPAGNIGRPSCWPIHPSVHPRACGEHLGCRRRSCAAVGSSPRLRGTFCYQGLERHYLRFIPAPAGNIGDPRENATIATVHPRACGEHSRIVLVEVVYLGSSPRLRGTFGHQADEFLHRRFIPAPAGNICVALMFQNQLAVHPRACGEHFLQGRLQEGIFGSSPRLRGTSLRRACCRTPCRFIPAPAGNIWPSRPSSSAASVHPRACGEHRWKIFLRPAPDGSSPRLRGTS